jgi:hypothetical protein
VLHAGGHRRVDQHVLATGVGYTPLRPATYFRAVVTTPARFIASGRWGGNAAGGRAAFIDPTDVGLVALSRSDPGSHRACGRDRPRPNPHNAGGMAGRRRPEFAGPPITSSLGFDQMEILPGLEGELGSPVAFSHGLSVSARMPLTMRWRP